MAAVLLMAISTAGCADHNPGGEVLAVEPAESLIVPPAGEPSATPSSGLLAEGLGAGPSVSASVSPSRTASKSSRPRPTRKPPVETKLPPPPPPPASGECKPRYEGTQATRAQAKQALTDAAGRTYWPNSAPSIKVPLNMVKAVAWQESGWQSNIIACDGGVGLMQVMQPTADYVNMRFEKSYDINDYRENAIMGPTTWPG
ncbi:MAG TPA: transglycosylase SLT domain-containing protein [Micromonospora sp.]|nr:transglycosylase SLT domain-containing protein [Micromonospora sp.]